MPKHPKLHYEARSFKTNDWELLNTHRNLVREYVQEHPEFKVRPIRTIDDLLEGIRIESQWLKESIETGDVMVDQLKAIGADEEIIDAVKKRRSA